tara:strand:+ start:396 stop:1718 length:1323 start_codon:yes stop_codon:yes gene_type:complete
VPDELEISKSVDEPSYCKSLVIVDDETSILTALERVFMDEDIVLETFDNAQDALTYCRSHPVAVVVSDARMPEMDGIEFLGILSDEFPNTERILLTGYTDIESTVAAINKGRVSYYLEKPWDEERLLRAVHKGIELANIRTRNRYLEDCLAHKNKQLTQWSQTLEQNVQKRTEQLREAYLMSVQSISSLVEKRLGDTTPNPRTVAQLCRLIGVEVGLDDSQLRDLRFAALLCHVGKMAFSDDLLHTAYVDLNEDQKQVFTQHPEISATTILFIPLLTQAADILRRHREQHNGRGYPLGCTAEYVAPSSFILGIALFYLECRLGLRFKRPLTHKESVIALLEQQQIMFPQELVELAMNALEDWEQQQQTLTGIAIKLSQLEAGMVLAQDLRLPDGILLLAQDKPIDDSTLDRLIDLEHKFPDSMIVHIKSDPIEVDPSDSD